MGLCLVALIGASASWFSGWTLESVIGVLQTALGLGFVIFVHELGHFAVAKMCGVQCDKFMIGFDIGGYKVGKQIGETYYGIGILPLGGYVKMLGQDDDPSKVAEQMEKSQVAGGGENAVEKTGPGGKTYFIDKRSYLAKSVPQRMAIISAGVIMNVIFGFIFAYIAFGIGVPRLACVAGTTTPGGAAWEAGLKTGDRITRIDDVTDPTFETMTMKVPLADLDRGVDFDVIRAGSNKTETLTLIPKKTRGIALVGVTNSVALRVRKGAEPAPSTPAGSLGKDGFKPGDRIVEVDGQPVETYEDLVTIQLANKNKPLTYTAIRGGKTKVGKPFGEVTGGERVTLTVPPNPRERLGIVSELGPIEAVQKGSPSIEAGLEPGDQLIAINGNMLGEAPNGVTVWDPLTLDDRLAELVANNQTATLLVKKTGEATPVEIEITPRQVTWVEEANGLGGPIGYAALGIACELKPVVASLMADSPAINADLKPGDVILSARVITKDQSEQGLAEPLKFEESRPVWPAFLEAIQSLPRDAKVELEIKRGDKKHKVELTTYDPGDSFAADRGIPLASLKDMRTANTVGEQASMAWDATVASLTQVYRFLQKLIEGQVPVRALGGPVTIAKASYASANDGFGSLLLFLTMLSANLAVLNFLPIPLLDGGHMVFLLWEGIRGKPADERLVVALHMIGFVCLISLMVFVFGLDLGFIDRGL